MGGQVGIVGHIEISDNVMIAGKSLVTKSIFKQDIISGIPAKIIKKELSKKLQLIECLILLKILKNRYGYIDSKI